MDFSFPLGSLSTNVGIGENSRVVRGTLSILRCCFFIDVLLMTFGIGMIVFAVTKTLVRPPQNVVLVAGGTIIFYAVMSAMINSLASHGVRTWRRGFLLPWLGFFMTVFFMLVIFLANSLYNNHFKWVHVFLFVATFGLYNFWRHMYKQFRLMSLPRPEQLVVDVESLVRGLSRPADLPPKYEDLEELPPPQYSSVVAETNPEYTETDQGSETPPEERMESPAEARTEDRKPEV